MELIVKLGADDSKLNATIGRMKAQFATMNTSMPIGWGGARGGGGTIMSSGQRQFLAQQDAAAASGLSGYAANSIVKKSTSYLKGLLFAEIASLAVEALDKLGTAFWEEVYGVSEQTSAKILASHKKIKEGVNRLFASRDSLQRKARESVFENATPGERLRMAGEDKAAADASVAAAQKTFAAASQLLSDMQTGKARNALTGDLILKNNPARRQAGVDLANAEAKLNEELEKQISASDRLRKANEDVLQKNIDNREKPKEMNRPPSFAADSLAQAGLFAGSSILFNPNGTVFKDQLDVLRKIDANTARLRDNIFT